MENSHTKWSWRVRYFHDLYKMSLLVYSCGILVSCAVNFYIFINYSCNDKISAFFIDAFSILIYSSVAAQLLTAKIIFRHCPLSLLEYQLRGDEKVKCYWVGKFSPGWAVGLLIGITSLVFVIFLSFFIFLKIKSIV